MVAEAATAETAVLAVITQTPNMVAAAADISPPAIIMIRERAQAMERAVLHTPRQAAANLPAVWGATVLSLLPTS